MTTSLIHRSPLSDLVAMQSAMDRLFEDTWRGTFGKFDEGGLALNVHETDKDYTVTAALPGCDPKDIQVTVQNDMLNIVGEVKRPEKKEEEHHLVQELFYGRYTRSIRLPQAVDREKVNAEYENGLLTLKLPKLPEAQAKSIPVIVKPNGHNKK